MNTHCSLLARSRVHTMWSDESLARENIDSQPVTGSGKGKDLHGILQVNTLPTLIPSSSSPPSLPLLLSPPSSLSLSQASTYSSPSLTTSVLTLQTPRRSWGISWLAVWLMTASLLPMSITTVNRPTQT